MTLSSLAPLVCLLAAPPALAADGASWRTDWTGASAASRREWRPGFLEIGAPWCQACQAMNADVLAGADFQALSAGMILLRENADDAEGKTLQKRFLAPF